MKYLLLDEDVTALAGLEGILKAIEPDCASVCFHSVSDAVGGVRWDEVDAVFCAIEMKEMDGFAAAERIREQKRGIPVLFLARDDRYAMQALGAHAGGYLLKPFSAEKVKQELDFLHRERFAGKRIRVRTFGGFDVFVDGRPVKFGRVKAKEFLAYLVDRRGSSVTVREAANILFEDGIYDTNRLKYMQTIYTSLCGTLRAVNAENMLLKRFNSYAVDPDTFDCDSYRLKDGDPVSVDNYRHDYMISYSWAEFSMGDLEGKGESYDS